jgi:hypothetical protein
MQLDFDEPSHTYTLNGRRVPSVTQVLDPLQMLDGIPWDVLEAARVFGNHVHTACHLYNLGVLDWDSLDPVLLPYIRAYTKFLTDTGFIVVTSEERVASVKCLYAGTLDLRGLLPIGKKRYRCIADIKSTAALPRTVGPQTAAYEAAFTEGSGEKNDRRYCLHLKPDEYKFVHLKDGPAVQDFTMFVSALNVWRWRNAA